MPSFYDADDDDGYDDDADHDDVNDDDVHDEPEPAAELISTSTPAHYHHYKRAAQYARPDHAWVLTRNAHAESPKRSSNDDS